MDNLMTHDKTTFRDLMSEYCEVTMGAVSFLSVCDSFSLFTC